MTTLEKLIATIEEVDLSLMVKTQERLDSLTKPLGSLGRLEELAKQVAGITRDPRPQILWKTVFTLAADHGVARDGVSAYPPEVTPQMVLNFIQGGAGINVLARHAGAQIVVADFGVAADLRQLAGLSHCKIRPGTNSIARGPAMSEEEALKAILAGAELVRVNARKGLGLIGTGDMGIGNTTPSSALAAVFTGLPAAEVTGRGTGIDDEVFLHKVSVIEKALAVNAPDAERPLQVLAKVGGFEIAGLVGVILAGASLRIPVLIDGFISGAAALVACRLAPKARGYLIASHQSVEKGHAHVLKHLELEPLLNLRLRLGEGTGAALAMPLVEAACKILDEMATFASAGVSERSERLENARS